MDKIKKFFKENKKVTVSLLIILGVVLLLTIAMIGIAIGIGVVDLGKPDIAKQISDALAALLSKLFNNHIWLLILVFLVIQIFFTTLLSFVPMTSMIFTLLGVGLFQTLLEVELGSKLLGTLSTFLILITGITISSQLMFLLGKYGGEKIAIKLVGEEDVKKAQKLLGTKTKVFLPLMYLLTFFPDDALCFAAGMQKMNFWRHLIYVVIFRGIGTATVVFLGSGAFTAGLSTIAEWYMFASVSLFWVGILFFAGKKLSDKLEEKGPFEELLEPIERLETLILEEPELESIKVELNIIEDDIRPDVV